MGHWEFPFKVKVSIGKYPVESEGVIGTGDEEGGVPSLAVDPRTVRDGRHHTALRHNEPEVYKHTLYEKK